MKSAQCLASARSCIKRLTRVLLIGCLSLPLAAAAYGAVIPDPPPLSAHSYILIDYHTGAVLVEKHANESLPMASLTKVMTAYAAYHALKKRQIHLHDEVEVSSEAHQAIGSRMFIEPGAKVKVEELLFGIVVQSGNDASVALAEHIGGSEAGFADLMNEHASQLGLTNSYFVNATGLSDKNHHMSARDNAILVRAMISEFPEYYQMYSRKEYTYNGIHQYNRNQLLWRNLGVDGVKTGYTKTAGYCLSTSAKRDGMRLIAVVLGSASEKKRFVDTERLLNYGFRFYKTYRLYEADTPMHQVRVWGGAHKYVDIGVKEDFYVTVLRNVPGKLQVDKAIQRNVDAPLERYQPIGSVTVEVPGDSSRSVPLVALTSMQQGNWFIRLRDVFLKLF